MAVEIITKESDREKLLRVDINLVCPNPWNFNEMAPHVFNELAGDIKEEGMDQPVVVIDAEKVRKEYPDNVPAEALYVIVDGEHRFRAHKAAGATTILISYKDWSVEKAMLGTARRNLHGETNPGKFTALVKRLSSGGMTMEDIKKKMVVPDKQFAKLFQGSTTEKAKSAKEVVEAAEAGVQKTFLVANLSQTIRDLVQKYGDNLPSGFIVFAYKGQTHMMVSMDAKLSKAVQEFKAAAEEDNLTADQICAKLAVALNKVS